MARDSEDDDRRPRLPTTVVIGGGLLLLAQVGLLAATLLVLQDSREHIQSQDAKVSALYEATRPALGDVPDVVAEVEPLVRDVQPLVDDAGPVLDDLSKAGAEVSDVTGSLPPVLEGVKVLVETGAPLAEGLLASDLPGLVSSLRASDIPAAADEAEELIAALAYDNRLVGTLELARSLLADVVAKDLPQRAVRSSERLQDLLEIQRQSRRILSRSFRVQIRVLARARSLDEKLGGEFPPDQP